MSCVRAPSIEKPIGGVPQGKPLFYRFGGCAQAPSTRSFTSNCSRSQLNFNFSQARLCALDDVGEFPSNGGIRDWTIWPVGDGVRTLALAEEDGSCLNGGFLDLAIERFGSLAGLQRLLSPLGGQTAAKLIPPTASVRHGQTTPVGRPSRVPEVSLHKWRSSEQQVFDLLTARGWGVYDVSKQNLGYDLEASKPDEKTIYVEVKTIDYAGQPFSLTSNEESVAREKGVAYRIAVVRQTTNSVEIGFIVDPARNLQMIRQCRQWVWFCDHYPFEPEQFAFEATSGCCN